MSLTIPARAFIKLLLLSRVSILALFPSVLETQQPPVAVQSPREALPRAALIWVLEVFTLALPPASMPGAALHAECLYLR